MDIRLTGIGDENIEAFSPLMYGKGVNANQIAVGAIVDDTAVGVCIFEITDDILFLDYIYVAEKYRRNGIASAMVNGFLHEVASAQPAAIHVNFPESLQDVLGLIESLHFKIFRDGTAYVADSKDFLSSDSVKKLMSRDVKSRVIHITDMTPIQMRKLETLLEKENLYSDMAKDPSLSQDLSIIILNEKGDPRSCLLAKEAAGYVVIHCLVNFGRDSYALMDILNVFSKLVEKKYKDGCKIYYVTMNEKTQGFAEKMIGDENLISMIGPVVSGIRTL